MYGLNVFVDIVDRHHLDTMWYRNVQSISVDSSLFAMMVVSFSSMLVQKHKHCWPV